MIGLLDGVFITIEHVYLQPDNIIEELQLITSPRIKAHHAKHDWSIHHGQAQGVNQMQSTAGGRKVQASVTSDASCITCPFDVHIHDQ